MDGLGNIGAGKYKGGSGNPSPVDAPKVGAKVYDRVTAEERIELLKNGVDISGESGIINTRGLGAKIGNNSLIAEHEEPKLIKTIDISDKQAIKNTLSDFESTAASGNIETACVITKDGKVYHCYGTADRVYPDSDLGDEIEGAYVTHSHTAEETTYSFSNDDFKLFENHHLEILRGCDEKYIYELNCNPLDIDDEVSDWQNEENFQHSTIRNLAIERGYGYRRWKK